MYLQQTIQKFTFQSLIKGSVNASFEFFLNCQQHKVDRSGNYFFPYFFYVKFVIVADKFDRLCHPNL